MEGVGHDLRSFKGILQMDLQPTLGKPQQTPRHETKKKDFKEVANKECGRRGRPKVLPPVDGN